MAMPDAPIIHFMARLKAKAGPAAFMACPECEGAEAMRDEALREAGDTPDEPATRAVYDAIRALPLPGDET